MNRYITTLSIILIISCLSLSVVQAKTYYKWTDNAGQLHITDHEPSSREAVSVEAVEAKERVQGKSRGLSEAPRPEVEDAPSSSGLERLRGIIPGIRGVGDPTALTFFAQFLFLLLFYQLCAYLIFRRTHVSYAWLSWIPLAGIFPFVGAAGYSWYIALVFIIIPVLAVALAFYIPSLVFVLIIIAVVVTALTIFTLICWMRICVNLQSSRWLALLLFVPYLQLLIFPYLAFKEQPIIRGINRLRPAVITLVVWVGCVAAFAMLSPHFADSQLFQSIKIDETEAQRWLQNIGLGEEKSAL